MKTEGKQAVKLSTEALRNLQLLELEMIVEIDRICRKHGVRYSLDGGTLLGAIRHKGFIPWDDDADVIFTRQEYARFYKACKKDLDTDRFFLQEYRTDEAYRWGYAKLRRKETEYVRVGQEKMQYRTGVCIDVFVVDHVPDQPVLRKLYYATNFCLRKILYSELGRMAEKSWLKRQFYALLYRCIPRDACFRIRNVLAARCNMRSAVLSSHLLYPYPSKATKYGMPSHCFEKVRETEFEGMQLYIFEEYDEYLSLLYNDYMKLPPVEKQVGCADASCIELIPITLEEIQERYQRENVKYQS